jgi:hypothetical protein
MPTITPCKGGPSGSRAEGTKEDREAWPGAPSTHLVPGTPDNGGEHGPGSVVARKASFAHTGAIVNDERSNFLFHGDLRKNATRSAAPWQ